MKRTRGNLTSQPLTILRLAAPFWFLVRPQLVTLFYPLPLGREITRFR